MATEELAEGIGPTLAGLINASFGNAVEIIVGITALMQNQFRIVQTSVRSLRPTFFGHWMFIPLQLLGSILSNLILVL